MMPVECPYAARNLSVIELGKSGFDGVAGGRWLVNRLVRIAQNVAAVVSAEVEAFENVRYASFQYP